MHANKFAKDDELRNNGANIQPEIAPHYIPLQQIDTL
tara:strand:- start:125 stop:235 length:111 start_codon:yes stop_codon:yes gene_type:complete